MPNKPTHISRKDALKKLGGLALSLPIGLPLVSSLSNIKKDPKSSASAFPNIIPHRRPDKPNILWITGEGVPLSVLSCYDGRYSKFLQTTNIDRIAKEGMQFQNSFCNNALCAPSRATLLTGKYNHLCGMETNSGNTFFGKESFFDPSQETFAKILKRNGYKTGMSGKWHLRASHNKPVNPVDAGFDYFVFKTGAGGPYYNPKGFIQNPSLGSKEMQHKEYKGYITNTFTDLAIDGMKQLKEPFCMLMQFFNDHRPFQPPHKYEHIYDDVRFPEPGTFWDDYKHRSSAAKRAHLHIADDIRDFTKDFTPPKGYTKRQFQQWNYQQLMRHFLGTLKSQDDNIGRLLDFLDESGLADNTIVVYTCDHGFFLGEHGWFDKRFMYEPALRVPWLIRFPGIVKPGSTSDAWVQSIDNAPTILDMIGLKVPDDMQGKSLVPILNGQTPKDWTTSMYYHYYEFVSNHFVFPNYGIRTERYKLISYYTLNEWELFDLERDPDEMDSLFKEAGMQVYPQYEDTLKDLLKQLKDLRKYYKDDTGLPVKFYPRHYYN